VWRSRIGRHTRTKGTNMEDDDKSEIESLKKAARRYEIARRINPQAWAELWALNISTNKPFDEIIDDYAPFVGV